MSHSGNDHNGCYRPLYFHAQTRLRQHDDWARCVGVRVQRACQSPFYSLLREEATRSQSSLMEAYERLRDSRRRSNTTSSRSNHSNSNVHDYSSWSKASAECRHTMAQDDRSGLFIFPGDKNTASVHMTRKDSRLVPESVTFVGDVHHHLSVYLAEEHLRRGISVTLLTSHELDKTVALYTNMAQHALDKCSSAPKHSSALVPNWVQSTDTIDCTRGGRRVIRHECVMRTAHNANDAHEDTDDSCSYPVTLEIIEGEAANAMDVDLAARHASVLYYMDPSPTLIGQWGVRHSHGYMATCAMRRPWQWYRDAHSGFSHCLSACTRVDGHLVYLTPRWTDSSRLSLLYWYRRCFTHPMCYVATVRRQERELFGADGVPSIRCYDDHNDGYDVQSDGHFWQASLPFCGSWSSWWVEVKEQLGQRTSCLEMCAPIRKTYPERTALPGGLATCSHRSSPVRFTSFRLSDVVYRSMNNRVLVAKNNNINDILHREHLPSGDLDVALLSSVLLRCIALCRVAVCSRLDISGTRRSDGAAMNDAAAVKNQFDRQRNE